MQRPSKPEKTMSSRLLTMKFMQRAAHAAASGSSSPQTPNQSVPSPRPANTISDSTRRTKRQRCSDQTASATDLEAIAAAIKAEEEKRAAAVARQAAEAGETEWVLEFPAGTVAQATEQPHIIPLGSYDVYGAGQEDDGDGRQEYGGYKRKKRTELRKSTGQADEENGARRDSRRGSDDEEHADDQPDGYRAEREAARKRKHLERREGKRLDQLTSISGAGLTGSGPPRHHHGGGSQGRNNKRGR